MILEVCYKGYIYNWCERTFTAEQVVKIVSVVLSQTKNAKFCKENNSFICTNKNDYKKICKFFDKRSFLKII